MENMISVIVCTFNQEDTISRTLDSILCQKCHVPFEIIIGEDCSTDGTLAICKTYQQKYPDIIRILTNHPNKGIVENYYDCLLACKGEYIADCAGDDYWVDDHKLEKELRVLEEHQEVTMVHTGWQIIPQFSSEILPPTPQSYTSAITDGKLMLEDIVTQTSTPVIHLCTSLYRKETFLKAYQKDEYLFRNQGFGCEDLQLSFIMALNGNIAYIPDVTLNYNMGNGSISNQADEEKQFHFIAKTTSLRVYLAEHYYRRTDKIEKDLSHRLFALYMHAFRSHNKTLTSKASQLGKEWKVRRTALISVVETVMKNELTWNIALLTRKLAVSLKRL